MFFSKKRSPELIDNERQINQEFLLNFAPFMSSFIFKKWFANSEMDNIPFSFLNVFFLNKHSRTSNITLRSVSILF